jgi:transcriptional regulator of arginine metabolism
VRSERRRDLIRLLREGRAHTQTDLVSALQEAGHDITQATVSRDLREVGATKVRVNGEAVYRLPDEIPRSTGGDLVARDLARNLDEFAVDIRPAASIVVVTTAPGHASAVARAMDLAGLPEVIGTVAGDDTIFVATPDVASAQRLADTWVGYSATAQL